MKRMLPLLLFLVTLAPFAFAQENDDLEVFGLELEKLLNLGSGLLAAVLSALTFVSYRRSGNKRLVYVSFAFLLFAIKSALVGSELFFGEWPWVDPVSSIADFAILVTFFVGVIKK